MMTRLPNWPEQFAAFIESRRFMPFEWGRNDCALFPADGILVMTGTDLAAAWRGYKSERGAARIIKRVGGLRDLALGAELIEKPVGLLHRGDVTLTELDGRDTFGLNVGNGFWCSPGANGLEFRPISEVRLAFGV